MYADDTSLISTPELLDLLKTDVNIVSTEFAKVKNWLIENRLSLNISKTKAMMFHHPTKTNVFYPEIKLDSHTVSYVSDFKFLGIMIDSSLSWKSHIEYISTKIMSCIGVLSRLKNIIPCDIKLKIYTGLIHCHLNFATVLWGQNCGPISKLQTRALRLVLNLKYNSAHTDSIYRRLKILRVDDIYNLCLVKFYNDNKLKTLPNYMLSMALSSNQEINDSYPNTRHAHEIHRTRPYYKSLTHNIPTTIPNIPVQIRTKLTHPVNLYSTCSLSRTFKDSIINDYSPIQFCSDENCWPCKNRK